MTRDSRYELLERVGTGSFATVYRARDNELGREVAIKQMHDQYLQLPEQMERYWQEAQLLASLQHPNIITFFDIDRERGWLIMELMQGTLGDRISKEPMDIASVRTALAHCLRALKYLHGRGIVHGDIKPSNMMIDARKRVKIGDFGLARRVSNEDGSLLKGTTKYMAPETVSDEWGDVGPASDLYSLGFAAFELLCGPNFSNLFPGLAAFGRDKQIAWMMWHAARDRRLPEIRRVLEGVPDDVAQVVTKLCEKDQSKRYATADEALSDLNIDVKIIKQGGEEPAATEPKKNQRTVAIVAFSVSMLLSLAMVFFPTSQPEVTTITEQEEPDRGVVRDVHNDLLVIESEKDSQPREIKLGSAPRILLNNKTYILPRELKPGDQVQISKGKDDDGRNRWELKVARPDESVGLVTRLQVSIGEFSLQVTEGTQRGELAVRVTGRTSISINGKEATLEELKEEDRATVRHVPDPQLGDRRIATNVEALQKRKLDGFIRDVDKGTITLEVRRTDGTKLVAMPAANECNVTVNGKQIVDGKLLKVADLKPGDRASIWHHRDIVEVHALRMSQHKGVVLDVTTSASSVVVGDDKNMRRAFVVGKKTALTINNTEAEITDLRRNDRIEVTYDSANERAEVSAIDALRPENENRVVIVIGNQAYDDNKLSKLPYAVSDAKLVHDTLLNRYGCSRDRTLLLVDETRVRLTQAIPDWLKKAGPQSELLVYIVGHAYVDDEGQPYYAAKDFELGRIKESGIPLSWLRQQLEDSPAPERLLLLDVAHQGDGQDLKQQPATPTMLAALRPPKDPDVFRRTWAIANSTDKQRGLVNPDKQHGVFAWFIARAYSGKGDKNSDLHLEPTELFDDLAAQMSQVEITNKNRREVLKQEPMLFRPNDAPPEKDRLSPEAKDSIRKLFANHWAVSKFSAAAESLLASDLLTSIRTAGEEPEPKLAFATIRMKVRNDDKEAQKYFEQVKLSHPKERLSYEGLAWIHTYSGRYRDAIFELQRLLEQFQQLPEGTEITEAMQRQLEFAGRLREFATTHVDEVRRPDTTQLKAMDGLLEMLPEAVRQAFESGRMALREKTQEFEKKIAAKPNSSESRLLELEQKRITSYARFDLEAARQSVLASLDR